MHIKAVCNTEWRRLPCTNSSQVCRLALVIICTYYANALKHDATVGPPWILPRVRHMKICLMQMQDLVRRVRHAAIEKQFFCVSKCENWDQVIGRHQQKTKLALLYVQLVARSQMREREEFDQETNAQQILIP